MTTNFEGAFKVSDGCDGCYINHPGQYKGPVFNATIPDDSILKTNSAFRMEYGHSWQSHLIKTKKYLLDKY